MARPSRYPLELRRRAVRMVAQVRDDYPNEAAALQAVAEKLDIGSRETLRNWVKQHEIDGGQRPAAGKLLARKRPRLLPVSIRPFAASSDGRSHSGSTCVARCAPTTMRRTAN